MAEAVASIALEVLRELLVEEARLLTQGEDVVRWIEYELETLIPQLERYEVQDRTLDMDAGDIRDIIRRAEDMAETHTKLKLQRLAGVFKATINEVKTWKISRQLHRIREDISNWRTELSRTSSLLRNPAVETQTVPSYLRRCEQYLLLFPPNNPVPARRLIVLWVAEGLVHPKKHDDKSAEQIARGYLEELRLRGMIRVAEDKRRGKLLTCSIDPRRRDKLMEEANKAKFLKGERGDIRRLVVVDPNGSSSGGDSFIKIQGKGTASLKSYQNVISFLSFNTIEGSKPGEEIGDFLKKCISSGCFVWLRVLDLERVFRPMLPDTLGRLITMKYLGLRWTYLQQLPISVEKLFNLQVLDVKNTYISVLPRSIWRMQFLTHLFLSEAYRTRFPKKPPGVTLGALQTLWGAFVDEDTQVQGGLDTLFNIRKLGLSCRSSASKPAVMTEQIKAIDKWISNLEYLESLRLKSRDEDNKAADLCLTSLKRNRKLSMVYLLGKLDSILLCKLPASLTNITLSGSNLQLDPLEFLGRLPKLTILRLLGQSVGSREMCCSKRAFPQLKFLWIWKLEKLEVFKVEQGSMPCLEELEMRDCQKLEALPQPLLDNLKLEIKLTSMPEKIGQKARSLNPKAKIIG